MTILQRLVRHYDRLVANERPGERPPEYGYSTEKVSYAVVLSAKGEIVDVMSLLDLSDKTPRPSLRSVPQSVIRTRRIVPNFLWDKTAYVFGKKRDHDAKQTIDAEREHSAFREFHEQLLGNTDDQGLVALRTFLRDWRPERYEDLPLASDMLATTGSIVFRFDGDRCFLHERPVARSIWLDHLAGQGGTAGLCLVTGENAPTERLHPRIKGIRGAQSSGASIVSFNLDAFSSLGKDQGANAPVSKRATFAYTTALNHLLAPGSPQSIQIGDTTTVFWAEAADSEENASAAEYLFSRIAEPKTDAEETAELSNILLKIAKLRPLKEIDPKLDESTRFHVLGLAPNAARLSIRFWCEDSFGDIARRVGQHWRDLHIEPVPWRAPPAAWRLLRETAAQGKADNIPPTLGGTLMRAILTGGRYPQSLLAAVIARIRADRKITGLRAAICKACLARDHRMGFEEEDVPVSLNPEETNPAYRLGRLFAVYEGVQRAALGKTNTTIKDQYFGAASATPASVFPLLERNSANHLASLRKRDKGGLAYWFDAEIDSIFAGMDTTFPRSLRLEEQGRFALGYHHQRATKGGASNDKDDTEPADTESHDED